MEKRGQKPKNKVKIEWSANFAYAIGLLVTDGCLSKDERHIDLTSKDREQLVNFLKCLGVNNKIGTKNSGLSQKYLRVQIGDVNFYQFLLGIGLMPKKSKCIAEVKIPNKYFFDFLRGHFDGDGSFYSYWDPRWKSSFMFYTIFNSASEKHIFWLREKIFKFLKIRGHITKGKIKICYQLKYAKKDSLRLLKRLYYPKNKIYLTRKRLKIEKALRTINKEL